MVWCLPLHGLCGQAPEQHRHHTHTQTKIKVDSDSQKRKYISDCFCFCECFLSFEPPAGHGYCLNDWCKRSWEKKDARAKVRREQPQSSTWQDDGEDDDDWDKDDQADEPPKQQPNNYWEAKAKEEPGEDWGKKEKDKKAQNFEHLPPPPAVPPYLKPTITPPSKQTRQERGEKPEGKETQEVKKEKEKQPGENQQPIINLEDSPPRKWGQPAALPTSKAGPPKPRSKSPTFDFGGPSTWTSQSHSLQERQKFQAKAQEMGFIEEVSFSDMGVQTTLSLTELGFEGADQVVEKLVESCNKKKEQETLGDTSRGQASAARSKARSKEAAKSQCRKKQEAEEEKEPKPKRSRNEQDKKGQGKKAKDK